MYATLVMQACSARVTVTQRIQVVYFGPIRTIIRWSQQMGVDKAFQVFWNLPSTSVDPVLTNISAIIMKIDELKNCNVERAVTSAPTRPGLGRKTMH
jgi:hypothetical protein